MLINRGWLNAQLPRYSIHAKGRLSLSIEASDRLIAQMEQALLQWDVWLCPVAMTTAFTHRPKGAAVEVDGKKVPYFMASGAYTMPFSLTGHPVVVIPIGQTRDGLPIGMQIVGKRWREMELLAIAQEINKVVGSFQHPPGYEVVNKV